MLNNDHMFSHQGRVTHICVSELTIIGSDNGMAPSHYLNQCWNILNWTETKKQTSVKFESNMMTSSNGNIFRVTGPLCGEFTGPRTKASDAEL